jgi:hypothetical protein
MNRRMVMLLSRPQGHGHVPATIKRAGCLGASYSLAFSALCKQDEQLYLY